MNTGPDNPPENRLMQGISEEDVAKAVSRSGYPLQTVVATHLRSDFDLVHEEWSYIDGDTGQFRTMDVFARKHLEVERSTAFASRVVSSLCLLIECKKSDLPYIFFLSPDTIATPDFPLICGLPELTLERTDGTLRQNVPIGHSLGLTSSPFLTRPPHCTSFSRLERKGKDKFNLSGNDPFNSLVHPLAKSIRHHEAHRAPGSFLHAPYIADITLGVGVLDAPMIGVEVSEDENRLRYVPWVRVVRHESSVPDDKNNNTHKLVALDIVHEGFFQTYLHDCVYPFSAEVASRVESFQGALVHGDGHAHDDWTLSPFRRNH